MLKSAALKCLRSRVGATLRDAAAVVVAIGLAVRPAAAGSISINMTTTASVRDGSLSVGVKVNNSGDEAASSVRPTLRLRDREARGTLTDTLRPGETIEQTLAVQLADLGPGRWPFRVVVDYTDANQYPFQALHVAAVVAGDPPAAKFTVRDIVIPPLSESVRGDMKVKNLTDQQRDAAITTHVPEGLEATPPTQQVAFAAWQEKNVRIELINRSALAGSRYPVFVVVEYDEGGFHQALIANSTVEIRAARALISRGLLWAVAVLVVGWLALLLWRGRRASG
jgi:hypothetical protein